MSVSPPIIDLGYPVHAEATIADQPPRRTTLGLLQRSNLRFASRISCSRPNPYLETFPMENQMPRSTSITSTI